MATFDPRRERTSELLARVANDTSSPTVLLADLLDAFGVRGYGILMVFASLLAFLPTPVGAGAIAGPLTGLLGLQMLAGQEHPWLPRWISQRGISRQAIGRFLARFGRWLNALERLCRPRRVELLGKIGIRLTGLLVVGHSVVLALPIPLTNFPLAAVLILGAISLIEDDGVLLAVSWALMASTVGAFLWFSGSLVEIASKLLS
jgi:hypothetical protein